MKVSSVSHGVGGMISTPEITIVSELIIDSHRVREPIR